MRRSFAGGYMFRGFLGQPLDELVDLGVPGRIIIGLKDGQGVALAPTVGKGETVRAGQPVALGPGALTCELLSSVSGIVEEVHAGNGGSGSIVIRSDGSPDWKPIEKAGPDAATGRPEVIERIISQSGVIGIPTRFATSPIPPAEVTHVIVNAVSADIYNPSLSLIAGLRVGDLISALRILQRICPQAAFSVALDDRAGPLARKLRSEAPRDLLSLRLLKAKFPQQKEEMLLSVVLNRQPVSGRRAIETGVLVLDVQAALAIHDAVVLGKPAIERIVALSGPGFTSNIHVRARVGTAISTVIESRLREPAGIRLVENSLLTGKQISDPGSTPIGPQTDSLIAVPDRKETGFLPFAAPGFRMDSYSVAFASRLIPVGKDTDTNLHGEERACLSCGFCDEVCPARILPSILHKYVKRGMIDDTLLRYGITRCIECNLCTYVCTSKIDVASLVRKGKARLEIPRIPVMEASP